MKWNLYIDINLAIRSGRVLMLNFFLEKENPQLLAGDSHFFVGVYKPNSVAILFTTGGTKLRILSVAKGVPSRLLGKLNFVNAYGKQNWLITICLGSNLRLNSSDSSQFASGHDLAQR